MGAAAGIVAPTSVIASEPSPSMAGGVYFTKESPGRWSKKVGGHLPVVEVTKKEGSTSIKVVTPHEMKGVEHYIVKHVVLNDKFEFIAEKMFDLAVDKAPISEFDLGSYTGRVNVLSVCNKHDTWLAHADV